LPPPSQNPLFSRSYPQVINNLAEIINPYNPAGIDMVTPYGRVVNEKCPVSLKRETAKIIKIQKKVKENIFSKNEAKKLAFYE